MDNSEISGERKRSMEVGRRMRRDGIVYHQLSDMPSLSALSATSEVSITELCEDSVDPPPTPDLPSDKTHDQGQCSSKFVHIQTPKSSRTCESSLSSGRLNSRDDSIEGFRHGGHRHNFKFLARKQFRSKETDSTKRNKELQEDSVKSPPTPDPSDKTCDRGKCSSKSVHTQTPKLTRKKESLSLPEKLDTLEDSFDNFWSGDHKLWAVATKQSRSKDKHATKGKNVKKNCKTQ